MITSSNNNFSWLTDVHLCSSYDQFIGEHFRSTQETTSSSGQISWFCQSLVYLATIGGQRLPNSMKSLTNQCTLFVCHSSQIFKNEPKMIVLLLIVVLPKESQRNVGSGMNITTNIISWLHEDNLLCFLIAHRGVHNARKRRPSL